MPGPDSPLNAARFTIVVDGTQAGRFDELAIEDGRTPQARSLQPHELAHVVQQGHAAGSTKWPNLVLKRGFLSPAALAVLKAGGGRRVSIEAAAPGGRITLTGARVERSRGQAKGNSVAMEELVLAHEGFG